MDRPNQDSPAERCAEHNLAVGPTGECVLCRREHVGPAARGWSPLLLAAGLGTALLAGVVLGRRRAPPPPPVVDATAAATVQPLEAPIEERPVASLTDPPPYVPPAATVPVPAPTPTVTTPQRNYLDEAYAAMPKSGLYDDAPAHSAPAQPSASASPPPRPRMGMGGHGRHGGSRH